MTVPIIVLFGYFYDYMTLRFALEVNALSIAAVRDS